MQKLITAIFMATLMSAASFAQTSDYNKKEFFVGYSNNQVDGSLTIDDDTGDLTQGRAAFHGFNVSGVYNFSRYFGVKADVSGTYRNRRFEYSMPTAPPSSGRISFDSNNSLYNFLGGIQIKDNASNKRLKPFAHVLAGVGHARTSVKNVTCDPQITLCSTFAGSGSETGFAGAFGGGLDVKLNDRIDIRVIQADYNPIRLYNSTQHNVRFGFGFVFK